MWLMLSLLLSPASGDAGRIVFVSDRDGNSNILLIAADGVTTTRLTEDPGNEWGARWHPDGTMILFISDRTGEPTLYSLPLSGGEWNPLRALRDEEPFFNVGVADGKPFLVFHRKDDHYDIYRSDLDGGNERPLTRNASKDYKPAVSPDGRTVIFTSSRDGNLEIYALDLADGSATNLTRSPGPDAHASFSPDGDAIVFRSGRDGDGNQEIYIMGADGSNQRRLTNHPKWELVSSWGSEIAFGSNRDGNWELYTVSPQGGTPRRLTDHPDFDGDPSWEPMRRQ